jgi:hypothetical protein
MQHPTASWQPDGASSTDSPKKRGRGRPPNALIRLTQKTHGMSRASAYRWWDLHHYLCEGVREEAQSLGVATVAILAEAEYEQGREAQIAFVRAKAAERQADKADPKGAKQRKLLERMATAWDLADDETRHLFIQLVRKTDEDNGTDFVSCATESESR